VIIVALVSLLAATGADRGATGAPLFEPEEMVIREWPIAELPREWRWEKPGVEYEHMFMAPHRDAAPGRLSWIRDGRR
jgi:hypothetical protein